MTAIVSLADHISRRTRLRRGLVDHLQAHRRAFWSMMAVSVAREHVVPSQARVHHELDRRKGLNCAKAGLAAPATSAASARNEPVLVLVVTSALVAGSCRPAFAQFSLCADRVRGHAGLAPHDVFARHRSPPSSTRRSSCRCASGGQTSPAACTSAGGLCGTKERSRRHLLLHQIWRIDHMCRRRRPTARDMSPIARPWSSRRLHRDSQIRRSRSSSMPQG